MSCVVGLDPVSIRKFLGVDESSLTDDQIDIVLNDAILRVEIDGVLTTNDNYVTLVRYAVGSLLVTQNKSGAVSRASGGSSGDSEIVEEKIGDITVKYGSVSGSSESGTSNGISDKPGGGYELYYLKLLRTIVGSEIMVL
jgi:hypothetical protein